MTKLEQKILFINRHLSLGMVAVDQGSVVTSEGNVYKFELVNGNYHRYIPPKKADFLNSLQKAITESDPIKKCDKNDIEKAYELAQQIDTKSELLLVPSGVCDYGSMTLYALINDNLVSLLSSGDFSGAVDCKEIFQIKDIMQKNDIFTFKFLRDFDMEKIRNDKSLYKYPCIKKFD